MSQTTLNGYKEGQANNKTETMKTKELSVFERKERLAQDIYDMLVQLRKLDPEDIDVESCVRDMDYYCRVSIKNSILKK